MASDEEWEKAKMEQIQSIENSQSREQDKLDNVIFILATGTLSLSATLINYSTKMFVGKFVLLTSWLLLISGLLSILLAYIFAKLHFQYFKKGVQEDSFKTIKEVENNWRNKWVGIFNLTSLIATSSGIIVFAYFAFLNLP